MKYDGSDITDKDHRLTLTLPYYEKYLAKRDELGIHPDITLELCLYQLREHTYARPLHTVKFNTKGLLAVQESEWVYVWSEIFKEEIPNIFNVDKQVEYHVRYMTYLLNYFKDMKLAMMAFFCGFKQIKYCKDNNCNFNRINSIYTYLDSWYKKHTSRGDRYIHKLSLDTHNYPDRVMSRKTTIDRYLIGLMTLKTNWERDFLGKEIK